MGIFDRNRSGLSSPLQAPIAPAAPAGANTSLSNLTTTSINQNLFFPTTNGGEWLIAVNNSLSGDPPTSLRIRAGSTTFTGGGGHITLQGGNSNVPGNITLLGGNAVGGVGGGTIVVTGTGGSGRGTFSIQDGSQGVVGYSWRSVGTSGEGRWSKTNVNNARVITGSATLDADTDYKVVCNAPAGAETLTFPPGVAGLNFIIGQAATNAATFTITPTGGDTLDANIQAIFNSNQPVPVTFISGKWYAI